MFCQVLRPALARGDHVPASARSHGSAFCNPPSFGSIYFWRTGLAFGATLCLALAFLLPYRFRLESPAQGRRHSAWSVAAFGFFALFTGMLEYNTPIICALLSVAACIYFYRESKNDRSAEPRLALYLAGALGMCLGCLIVFLAPAMLSAC